MPSLGCKLGGKFLVGSNPTYKHVVVASDLVISMKRKQYKRLASCLYNVTG